MKRLLQFLFILLPFSSQVLAQTDSSKPLTRAFIDSLSREKKDVSTLPFDFFLSHIQAVDAVMGKGYAENWLEWAIYVSHVDTLVKAGQEVNWKALEKTLKQRYGALSQRPVLQGRVFLSYKKQDWPVFVPAADRLFKDFPGFVLAYLRNNFAFEVFQKVAGRRLLQIALNWSHQVIQEEPKAGIFIDTYANLLYKLGRKEEAIKWQEHALEVAIADEKPAIRSMLEKMKAGAPTW